MKISFQAGREPVELTVGGMSLTVQPEQNISARVTLEIREQDAHEEQPAMKAEPPACEMPAAEAAAPPEPVIPEYLPPEAEQDLIELLKELSFTEE